jgi:hypothetical protein
MAASGEIERDLIPFTRLDDDDIDELHAANRFASRSAYFGQHVAGQRALKNMHCTMLFRAVLTRKRFKLRQSQRGLLAIESHQGHAQSILGGGDAA